MDGKLLWKSIVEVLGLSFIAFLPLLISLIIQTVKHSNLNLAFLNVIHPSEIIAFCLSFLAPSIYFMKKTHGTSYKVPLLDFFYLSTFAMYGIALVFVIIIKNNIDPDIAKNINEVDYYIYYTLVFLFFTIIYRIYSTYHQSKSSSPNVIKDKKDDEDKFVENFKNIIHGKQK